MKLLLLCLLLVVPAWAAKKNPDWLTGTTLDTAHNRYFAGTIHESTESGTMRASDSSTTDGDTTDTDVSGTYSGPSSGVDTAIYRAYETCVIGTGSMVYMAQERMRWRWLHPARLTVNGNVKYYLDGRHIHLLDEDGKGHEAEIVKQILKQPPPGESNA
jgi:hypothetical protein